MSSHTNPCSSLGIPVIPVNVPIIPLPGTSRREGLKFELPLINVAGNVGIVLDDEVTKDSKNLVTSGTLYSRFLEVEEMIETGETGIGKRLDALQTSLAGHVSRTDNPHSVTANQVGTYTQAQIDEKLRGKLSSESDPVFTGWKNGVALSLGHGTVAENYTTAIGVEAKSSNSGMAIGTVAIASGLAGIAIGNGATAKDSGSVVLGWGAQSNGEGTITFGHPDHIGRDITKYLEKVYIGDIRLKDLLSDSYLSSESDPYFIAWKSGDTLAAGEEALVSGSKAVGLGHHVEANSLYSVAVGPWANSSDVGAVAIGYATQAAADNSIALGATSAVKASDRYAISLGIATQSHGPCTLSVFSEYADNGPQRFDSMDGGRLNAVYLGDKSLKEIVNEALPSMETDPVFSTWKDGKNPAAGQDAKATGNQSVAFGVIAEATADGATAIGGRAEASGAYGTAVGHNALASKSSGSAFGVSSTAKGTTATAVGSSAAASGLQSLALGNNSGASHNYAIAIGPFVSSKGDGTVAIQSETRMSGFDTKDGGRLGAVYFGDKSLRTLLDADYPKLENSLIPSKYLPSYVDDVLEYANLAAFPTTGESGKIYVTKDTNLTYRWSGSAYVEISKSLALGETSTTAYAGDKGKTLADNYSTLSETVGNTVKSLESLTSRVDSSDALLSKKLDYTETEAYGIEVNVDKINFPLMKAVTSQTGDCYITGNFIYGLYEFGGGGIHINGYTPHSSSSFTPIVSYGTLSSDESWILASNSSNGKNYVKAEYVAATNGLYLCGLNERQMPTLDLSLRPGGNDQLAFNGTVLVIGAVGAIGVASDASSLKFSMNGNIDSSTASKLIPDGSDILTANVAQKTFLKGTIDTDNDLFVASGSVTGGYGFDNSVYLLSSGSDIAFVESLTDTDNMVRIGPSNDYTQLVFSHETDTKTYQSFLTPDGSPILTETLASSKFLPADRQTDGSYNVSNATSFTKGAVFSNTAESLVAVNEISFTSVMDTAGTKTVSLQLTNGDGLSGLLTPDGTDFLTGKTASAKFLPARADSDNWYYVGRDGGVSGVEVPDLATFQALDFSASETDYIAGKFLSIERSGYAAFKFHASPSEASADQKISVLTPDNSPVLTETLANTKYYTKAIIDANVFNGTFTGTTFYPAHDLFLETGYCRTEEIWLHGDPRQSTTTYDTDITGLRIGIDKEGSSIPTGFVFSALDEEETVVSSVLTPDGTPVVTKKMLDDSNAKLTVVDGQPTTVEHGKFYCFRPNSTSPTAIIIAVSPDSGKEDEAKLYLDYTTARSTITISNANITILYAPDSYKLDAFDNANGSANRYMVELKWWSTTATATGAAANFVLVNAYKVGV